MNRTLLAATLIALPFAVSAQTLCNSSEIDYFSCRTTNSKIISICGAAEAETGDEFWLQYRFGKVGAHELVFPQQRSASSRNFEGNYFNPVGEDHAVVSLRFIYGGALFEVELVQYFGKPPHPRLAGSVSVETNKTVNISCQQPIPERYLERFRNLTYLLRKNNADTDFLYEFYRGKKAK